MSNQLSYLLALLAIVVALVVGCGGDPDDSTQASGPGRSPAAAGQTGEKRSVFARRADAICERATAAIYAEVSAYLRKRADSGETEQQLLTEAIDSVFLPRFEEQTEEIRELEVPTGSEDRVSAFLAASKTGIATARKMEFTRSNLSQFGNEFEEARTLGRQLGLESCAFYQQ